VTQENKEITHNIPDTSIKHSYQRTRLKYYGISREEKENSPEKAKK
jgi:hypothetical protein